MEFLQCRLARLSRVLFSFNTQNEAYSNVAAGSYYCCRFCARQQAPIYISAPCSNNDISAAHLIILGMLGLGFSLTLQFHLLGLQLGFNRKHFVLISLISWHSTTTLVAQYSFHPTCMTTPITYTNPAIASCYPVPSYLFLCL